MDIEAIRKSVMQQLGLTSPADAQNVEDTIIRIAQNLLTDQPWAFLDVIGYQDVTSATDEYNVPDDFLYIDEDSICYVNGKIEIRNEDYIRSLYPDLADLDDLKFLNIIGRMMKFYSVNGLSEITRVYFTYHRRGKLDDLDVDPGFVDIIRNGTISEVAKGGTPMQVQAMVTFQRDKEKKANVWMRHFRGETRIVPEERHGLINKARSDIRWD